MEIILDAYGTFVQLKNKMLYIKPQEKEALYIPLHDISSLIICPGIRITSDTLFSLLKNHVDVILQQRNGRVDGRLWNHKFGSIATIRKNQIKMIQKPIACQWVVDTIYRKIKVQKDQMATLYPLYMDRANHPGKNLEKIEGCLSELELLPRHQLSVIEVKLRNIEARSAQHYWSWVKSLIPNTYKFEGRVTRNAADPVNSMLSYGYAMLYHKAESALIKSGLDPQIGWFHKDQYNKPVLVYDFIEPFRAWIDYVVFELCIHLTIPKALFKISDEQCEMSRPARKILAVSVNKYLDQRIEFQGKMHKREYIIFLEAQTLAGIIKRNDR